MQFTLEAFAAWATIVATAASLLALLQSQAWLVIICLLFLAISVTAILYARSRRLALQAASTIIEGQSIDSLNIANLRRRIDRSFVIHEAHHTASIEGPDIRVTWQYEGHCKAGSATAMEFSLDSDSSTSFEEMNCVAYDLKQDPGMAHPIRPLLIGSPGLSKKVSVPFLVPLRFNQPFKLLLTCTLPRCITPGHGYYTSTLSFAQKRVPRCEVRLLFRGSSPAWIRVYEATAGRPVALVRSLHPSLRERGHSEYVDVAENRSGQSARVYMFWLDTLPASSDATTLN